MLSPILIITILVLYFSILILIAKITQGRGSHESFFLGKRESPWYIVAYGMIGATLSGVTFLSVPGMVKDGEFFYMQMVLGYVPGYLFVAYVLMPIYYNLKVYSIYEYLKHRFGYYSNKCGASCFFLSRLLGASVRLYLVALVLQELLFNQLGIPFFITTLITIILIWLYTYRGGIKTIIWTDTLQTTFMLLTVFTCIIVLFQHLSYSSIADSLNQNLNLRIFSFDDFNGFNHFIRSFLTGMFIAIAMTGLDQDMMQKNLSCTNIHEAKKNMVLFSVVLVFVNILFLYLGALLYEYSFNYNIDIQAGDYLFVQVVNSGGLGVFVFVLFLLGLMSAAYSSADSALTSLTTSFCIDFLEMNNNKKSSYSLRRRISVHLFISFLLFCMILLVNYLNTYSSIIDALFAIAGYTYGPLLGLFMFGLFTNRKVVDSYVPFIVLIAPGISFLISKYDEIIFNGFQFSHDLIIINGGITYVLLYILSNKKINHLTS
ncbi:MAG: sodium:solute symporter [Flavobacteriales bacterium]|nr:sodium:solute symporter [Flavobacteriales bacterium]